MERLWADLLELTTKWPPTVVLGDCNASLTAKPTFSEEDGIPLTGSFYPACVPEVDDIPAIDMPKTGPFHENTFHQHEGDIPS